MGWGDSLYFLGKLLLSLLWPLKVLVFVFQDISLENVSSMYELSDAFHAMSLRHTCILFILEHFHKLNTRPGYVLHSVLPIGSSSLLFKLN